MTLKATRKIRLKTVRNLPICENYRFKQVLKHKAKENGKLVVDVCEACTSKTVWTGEIRAIEGANIIRSVLDAKVMARDVSGDREIFLRALVAPP